MLEPSRSHRGIPVILSPSPEVEVRVAPRTREQQPCVQTRGHLTQRLLSPSRERNSSERSRLLAVQLQIATDDHATDMNNVVVYVGAL